MAATSYPAKPGYRYGIDIVNVCKYTASMSPLRPTNFRLDEDVMAALREIKERDGVPVSEQVRRALLAWVESKGVKVTKAERKRPASRKRS